MSAPRAFELMRFDCDIIQVKLHGRNMTSVYENIDKSVLPDEYLPDDYTGPSAGPLQKCIGKPFYINLQYML